MGVENSMNSEMKEPENNLDRAIEFLENRKIESLNNLTTEVERKDLSKEFEKGIQVLKDRKKKLMNIQKLTEQKKNGEKNGETDKVIKVFKDRKKKLVDIREVTEQKKNEDAEKRNGKKIYKEDI
ncbi:MAG: hypothetical protein QG610_470 [Euryarchaeota archaeon]|nr:hypothetical protein [Euryarchaeota archaeon]